MSYKQVIITEFGGPEKIQLVEQCDLPQPAAGEVRVRVLAAGTGFTDTIIREGQYPGVKEKPPFTLGYDWYGVVDAIGDGVHTLDPGDFVADMPVIGGYTQYLCAPAERLVRAPEGLDPAEAVCMILSYTTAYQMLTRETRLQAGMSILVHAAGGAVGSALLELGRSMGLTMYGTASNAKKALVESYGATHINYRSEDFVQRLGELEPAGVDAVYDAIGGVSWSRSYRCLKRGGTLVGYGALKMKTGEETLPVLLWGFARLLLLWRLLPDGKRSRFYNIQSRREKHPQEFKEDVITLFELLKEGKLKPAVADTVPLDRAADVHRLIDDARVAGKVVLICTDRDRMQSPCE